MNTYLVSIFEGTSLHAYVSPHPPSGESIEIRTYKQLPTYSHATYSSPSPKIETQTKPETRKTKPNTTSPRTRPHPPHPHEKGSRLRGTCVPYHVPCPRVLLASPKAKTLNPESQTLNPLPLYAGDCALNSLKLAMTPEPLRSAAFKARLRPMA